MRGWIYVISNKAMVGLVKVGHSTKDPRLRAGELDNTGSPNPYIVEVDVLVEEPYQIEQQVQRNMMHLSAGKEWFRCTPKEALKQILRVTNGKEIHISKYSEDQIDENEYSYVDTHGHSPWHFSKHKLRLT